MEVQQADKMQQELYFFILNSIKLLLLHAVVTITGWIKCGGMNNGWDGRLERSMHSRRMLRMHGGLKDRLLLINGEMDNNVDPASTEQLVNALIKANKEFEYVFVPGAKHISNGGVYGSRKRRDFFVKYLLGDRSARLEYD